jgi:hypothetical protein
MKLVILYSIMLIFPNFAKVTGKGTWRMDRTQEKEHIRYPWNRIVHQKKEEELYSSVPFHFLVRIRCLLSSLSYFKIS